MMSEFESSVTKDRLAEGRRKYGTLKNTEWVCGKCGKDTQTYDKFIAHQMGAHGESREMAIARANGIKDPEYGKK
jgi:hypothetical protein